MFKDVQNNIKKINKDEILTFFNYISENKIKNVAKITNDKDIERSLNLIFCKFQDLIAKYLSEYHYKRSITNWKFAKQFSRLICMTGNIFYIIYIFDKQKKINFNNIFKLCKKITSLLLFIISLSVLNNNKNNILNINCNNNQFIFIFSIIKKEKINIFAYIRYIFIKDHTKILELLPSKKKNIFINDNETIINDIFKWVNNENNYEGKINFNILIAVLEYLKENFNFDTIKKKRFFYATFIDFKNIFYNTRRNNILIQLKKLDKSPTLINNAINHYHSNNKDNNELIIKLQKFIKILENRQNGNSTNKRHNKDHLKCCHCHYCFCFVCGDCCCSCKCINTFNTCFCCENKINSDNNKEEIKKK